MCCCENTVCWAVSLKLPKTRTGGRESVAPPLVSTVIVVPVSPRLRGASVLYPLSAAFLRASTPRKRAPGTIVFKLSFFTTPITPALLAVQAEIMVVSNGSTPPPAVSPPSPAPATPSPSPAIPSPTAYPTPDASATDSPTAPPPVGDLQTVGPLPLAWASEGSDLEVYYVKVNRGGRASVKLCRA